MVAHLGTTYGFRTKQRHKFLESFFFFFAFDQFRVNSEQKLVNFSIHISTTSCLVNHNIKLCNWGHGVTTDFANPKPL